MKKILVGFLLLTLGFFTVAEEVDPDPFENVNRSIYDFNEAIDDNVLEPVSRAYKDHVP